MPNSGATHCVHCFPHRCLPEAKNHHYWFLAKTQKGRFLALKGFLRGGEGMSSPTSSLKAMGRRGCRPRERHLQGQHLGVQGQQMQHRGICHLGPCHPLYITGNNNAGGTGISSLCVQWDPILSSFHTYQLWFKNYEQTFRLSDLHVISISKLIKFWWNASRFYWFQWGTSLHNCSHSLCVCFSVLENSRTHSGSNGD